MLKSSCIRSTLCFPPKSYSGLVILDYRESKDSVLQTCRMVVAPLTQESFPTDGRTGTQLTIEKHYLATNEWRE